MTVLAVLIALAAATALLARVARPRRGAYRFIVALRPLAPLPTAQDHRP